MEELIRLENINFSYGDKPALKDVSVTIHKSERIAVLGNNGAGKSTFFLCCNGVLRPQNGKIFLNGHEITKSKKDISTLRQTVGVVFQEPDSQIIAGTVESEVSFGPMNLRLAHDEVADRVTKSIRKMNLEIYRNHAPQYLSGGEKKRVSIADILAMQPDMMLLDEPTASLDPENVEILEHTLDELSHSGITIVVSTHDVDFAYRFAERAIIFRHGEIIADANIDDVFSSDNVLFKAGLKKPSLYAAAELLKKHFNFNKNMTNEADKTDKKPRRIEDFEDYINKL